MNQLVDEVKIVVKAGNGGRGCDSRQRISEKKYLLTGGEGGRGGSVTIRTDVNVTSLKGFLYHRRFEAESGEAGGSNHKRGRKGRDLAISVPCGTVVYQKEKQFLIRDLVKPGDEVMVVEGGRGGVGNEGRKEATPGEQGPSLEIILTLKIPADVFLLGLPNSGKSKLLNRLTRAHSKEEAYPFSTKHPQLGIYETADFRQIRICELPAIYRESFSGRGAGTDFLKHLDRAKLIVLMLDPLNTFAASLMEGYDLLVGAMERYQKPLLEIPRMVLINKMDLLESRARVAKEKFHPSCPFFLISAETGEGVDAFTGYVTQKLKEMENV